MLQKKVESRCNGDSIEIDVFPMDPMGSIARLSNPPQIIVYTSGFIL